MASTRDLAADPAPGLAVRGQSFAVGKPQYLGYYDTYFVNYCFYDIYCWQSPLTGAINAVEQGHPTRDVPHSLIE
ncbi:hypothetical protein U879_01760 [Defluviimonas sp. 20V17]|nr:hypothetical protein U879_01760 [Defluviimonas sp. 20V17]